ncbi:hypothetical protein Zmor_006529 [Zophobas morio]|uniref:Uncharacterized protein n=1 Tax=Zophobas morio TaxID=2755281 RepID=A0AA38IQA1_9CUCU|nr:hypothetical protein Zmor_006529 [Zophobas morio]
MRTVVNSTCFHKTRGTGTRGKKLAKRPTADSPSDGWNTTAARSQLTLREYNRSSSETKDASSSSGRGSPRFIPLLPHCFHPPNCCGQSNCEQRPPATTGCVKSTKLTGVSCVHAPPLILLTKAHYT